ncbi:hydrolase [Actinoallomurus spadix]|uniref:Beta-phosphoglucomutase n=1 Tax=Actinoallomurus spadix TaxID=79912 RepID=A0ABN0VQ58_9ACTN|nr:HAD family hydrolase [Actinoallomurus spadix]MCO5990789.1 hydrolase [Actinoallomurus spadix]
MRTTAHEGVRGDIAAVIFGVDGVLLDTARASGTAWKAVLDPFLRSHAAVCEQECRYFDAGTDYRRYMQGRTTIDGLREYLTACEIPLCFDALRGLSSRHEEEFLTIVRRLGVRAFASSVGVVHAARLRGLRTATVSATRYAAELLRRAGVAGLFDVRLDALDPIEIRPATADLCLLREAARRMGTPPARTAVIEENLTAVRAARRGGFGLIIGVDRGGRSLLLPEYGAHQVITDLSELMLEQPVA